MDIKNKKILVCGMARSGISVSMLLKNNNADVTIQDLKSDENLEEAEKLRENGISLYLGKNPTNDFIDLFDIIVLSPGVPTDLEFIKYAKKRIPVISEIEASYLFCKADIIAITGTNGKTTTTSLVYHILKDVKSTYIGGNIGIPFSENVIKMTKNDVVVLELSSFQLETINKFKPYISAILNISEDHLNRHKTMENYINAKKQIFKNQDEKSFTILNYDDLECKKIENELHSKVLYFSLKKELEKGAYLKEGYIYINNEKFINIDEVNIFGEHNVQNVMSSILICLAYGVDKNVIIKNIKTFKAVEHRMEYVATKKGVEYYNDSKATNPDSTIKAINSMKKPTYIIIGGSEKNSDYTKMIKSFNDNIKKIILIGEVKQRLKEQFDNLNITNYILKENLLEATKYCYKNALDGEVVLLSPACASFDMFKNYEERGEKFKSYVNNFKG